MSLFASTLFIVALILPQLIQQFRKIIRYSRTTTATVTANTTQDRRSQQQQQRNASNASNTNANTTNVDSANSFNMNLVYLAIPDFIFNTLLVTVRCSIILDRNGGVDNWAWLNSVKGKGTNGNGYARFVMFSCNSISLYMKAVIVHEVYQLLKNSNQLIRQPLPTLLKIILSSYCCIYIFIPIKLDCFFYARCCGYSKCIIYIINNNPFMLSIFASKSVERNYCQELIHT
jgi:hypothetical protein